MNRVIDTNVLIVASAHAVHPAPHHATPTGPELREQVFNWVSQFAADDATIVLDSDFEIRGEYDGNLSWQDFGTQVLQSKYDRNLVVWVVIAHNEDGFASLPASLDACKWDSSDRKFGCAAFEARKTVEPVEIVNASDTDWYDVAPCLAAEEIGLRQLIDGWCRNKYRMKNGHEPPAA